VIQHAYLSWAAVTLDGWCDQLDCPIEAKHVGGREPLEVIIDRYQPQLQWCMEVTGAERCALSVISGVNPPVIEFIERDVAYADELVRRGAMFMNHVRDRTPPIDLTKLPSLRNSCTRSLVRSHCCSGLPSRMVSAAMT